MALKVQTHIRPVINTTVKKVQLPLVNLDELKDVNTTGLQDGYTLVWNETSQTWITQSITLGGIGNIDGGTY